MDFQELSVEASVIKTGNLCVLNSDMTTFQQRVESFSAWPTDKFPKPEQLAGCGFYLNDEQTHLTCFYCLQSRAVTAWKIYDNPWIEHAIINPYCPYLLLHRSTVSAFLWNSIAGPTEPKTTFHHCLVFTNSIQLAF